MILRQGSESRTGHTAGPRGSIWLGWEGTQEEGPVRGHLEVTELEFDS